MIYGKLDEILKNDSSFEAFLGNGDFFTVQKLLFSFSDLDWVWLENNFKNKSLLYNKKLARSINPQTDEFGYKLLLDMLDFFKNEEIIEIIENSLVAFEYSPSFGGI